MELFKHTRNTVVRSQIHYYVQGGGRRRGAAKRGIGADGGMRR